MHLSPASIISHLEESITKGTLEISGSAAIRFRKRTIASLPSNIPSSILISIIWAPSSTWVRQISIASSNSSLSMRRLNLAEPVTLALSPILINLESLPILKASSPESRDCFSISGKRLGAISLTES